MKFEKLVLVIFALFFFSASASGAPNDFQPVEVNDINHIFTTIAASTQSNYQRINTWEGEIEAGKTKRKFTIDMKSNSLFIRFTPMTPTPTTSPRAIILTPDYGIECSAYTKDSDGKVKQNLVVKSPTSGTADMMYKKLTLGDPRIYLEGNMGAPIWDFMQKTKEFISKNGLEVNGKPAIRIEQRSNGDYVDYCIHIHRHTPDNQPLGTVMTMTFSGDKSFYMTSRKIQDANGVLETETASEYTVVDGIIIPSRIYTVQYAEGEKHREDTIVIMNTRVNQSIPEGSFTYENLGLKDGDKFIDKILNKEYRYEAATKKIKPVEK